MSLDKQRYLNVVAACTEVNDRVAIHESMMENWENSAHSYNDAMVTAFDRIALALLGFRTLEGFTQQICNIVRKEIIEMDGTVPTSASDPFSQQDEFNRFSHRPSLSSSDAIQEDESGAEEPSTLLQKIAHPKQFSSAIEMTLRRQIQAMEWALEAKSESMLSMQAELENSDRERKMALQRQEADVRKLAILTERVGILEGHAASLTAQLWRSQQAEEELAQQLGETEVEGLERVTSMGHRWRGDLVDKEGELVELRRANKDLQTENVRLREGQAVLDSLSGCTYSDEGVSRDSSIDEGSVHGRRDSLPKVWSGILGWFLREEGTASTSDICRFESGEENFEEQLRNICRIKIPSIGFVSERSGRCSIPDRVIF